MERKLGTSLLFGLRGRCPKCGEGHLFRKFMKVADACDHCGEPLHHHRADDFPAYLVIFIVGHVVVPLTLIVEVVYAPAYWIHALIWGPLIIGLSLALLQPVKGLVVALQWHTGMHGFAEAKRARALEAAQTPSAQPPASLQTLRSFA